MGGNYIARLPQARSYDLHILTPQPNEAPPLVRLALGLGEKLLDFANGRGQSLALPPRNFDPRKTALRQYFLETPCHPPPDGLSIPQSVLHKRNVAIGEEIEIVPVRRGNRLYFRGAGRQVALMPDPGSQNIRIAYQQAVGLAGQSIFCLLLLFGNLRELRAAPLVGPQVHARSQHLLAVF